MAVIISAFTFNSNNIFDSFETGDPEIKSFNALAFGQEAVLLIGDSKSASVFDIETSDTQPVELAKEINMRHFL